MMELKCGYQIPHDLKGPIFGANFRYNNLLCALLLIIWFDDSSNDIFSYRLPLNDDSPTCQVKIFPCIP